MVNGVCLGVEVGSELLSERSNRGRHTNHINKSIPNSGSIKRKAMAKLFDRLLRRWIKFDILQ